MTDRLDTTEALGTRTQIAEQLAVWDEQLATLDRAALLIAEVAAAARSGRLSAARARRAETRIARAALAAYRRAEAARMSVTLLKRAQGGEYEQH